MSAEGKLGKKKLRQAEELLGEPLLMGFATDHPLWECITPDDRHFVINRRSGEVSPILQAFHWNTCPSRTRRRGDDE